jgi:hypothetical protein
VFGKRFLSFSSKFDGIVIEELRDAAAFPGPDSYIFNGLRRHSIPFVGHFRRVGRLHGLFFAMRSRGDGWTAR